MLLMEPPEPTQNLAIKQTKTSSLGRTNRVVGRVVQQKQIEFRMRPVTILVLISYLIENPASPDLTPGLGFKDLKSQYIMTL